LSPQHFTNLASYNGWLPEDKWEELEIGCRKEEQASLLRSFRGGRSTRNGEAGFAVQGFWSEEMNAIPIFQDILGLDTATNSGVPVQQIMVCYSHLQ
jgi:hypothetical protein